MSLLQKVLQLSGTFLPSCLRIILLRALGHSVGKRVRISPLTVLLSKKITLADEVRIGPLNLIIPEASLNMGAGSEISFLVIVAGSKGLTLGSRSYVSVKTLIDTAGGVTIGEYTGTGPGTMIYSHATFLPPTEGFPRVFEATTIGNRCWLGGMTFVAAGTEIGHCVMSKPGLTLSGKVPSNVFVTDGHRQIPMDRIRNSVNAAGMSALIEEIKQSYVSDTGKALPNATFLSQPVLTEATGGSWYNFATLTCHVDGAHHAHFRAYCRRNYGIQFLSES